MPQDTHPPTGPVLTKRQLIALGVVPILTLVPVTLPVPVLTGLVTERFHATELQTNFFMSVNMIGAVLASPLAGLFADRIGSAKRWVAIGLALDALLLLALTLPVSYGTFVGIRFLEGAAHIFALSLLLALAADCAGTEKRGRTMGLVGGGITLGVAIGAPLGGLIGRNAPTLTFYAGATIAVAAALIAITCLPGNRVAREHSSIKKIVAALRAQPALLAPLAFAFIDRFTVGFYTTTFSRFLKTTFDLSPPRIGLLIAGLMLPFALLSYPFGRLSERVSRSALLCGGSLLYGLGTIAVGWCTPSQLFWLMPVLGVFSAVMFVPSLVMTTDLAPREARATALGGFNAMGSLGFIVGPIAGALVTEAVAPHYDLLTGFRAAFVTAGVSEILCVLLLLPLLARLVRRGLTT